MVSGSKPLKVTSRNVRYRFKFKTCGEFKLSLVKGIKPFPSRAWFP